MSAHTDNVRYWAAVLLRSARDQPYGCLGSALIAQIGAGDHPEGVRVRGAHPPAIQEELCDLVQREFVRWLHPRAQAFALKALAATAHTPGGA